ncbi:hypothetical protein [Paraburkholderia silvatlantica]|nr:hypothetical protein [Paraburkholderia silvatlantica]
MPRSRPGAWEETHEPNPARACFARAANVGASAAKLRSRHRASHAQGLAAYIACGIPGNLMLARVGARRWISFIMIAWGLASTATIFATSAATPYWLRMLTAQGGAPLVQLRGVCLASAESYTAMSIFWTTPDQACTPKARAVGIAVIHAIGNI